MLYIAVCDDDKTVCTEIEDALIEYSKQHCMKNKVEVFYSGESLLEYMEKGNNFDLLYLDIEMGHVNGVEVGRRLRRVYKNYSIEIVYISANDGYDRQLFEVQPLHFIAKPIDASVVIKDLELAIERGQRLGGFFKYKKGYDIYKIPINEIIYFESLNREIKMVTTKGEELFYSSLSEVILNVTKYQFIQIHRSYLINYNHASVLGYTEVVMSNGTVLPISKSKREAFRNLQIEEE